MRLKNVGVCGVGATSWNRHSSTDQPLLPRAGTASAAVDGANVTAAAAIAVNAPSRRTAPGRAAGSLFQTPVIVSPLGGEYLRRPSQRKQPDTQLIHTAHGFRPQARRIRDPEPERSGRVEAPAARTAARRRPSLPALDGSGTTDRVHFSINIPNFGDFADARTVAKVATAAEAAGWDALFVWDHVVHDKRMRRGQPFGDPWMLLTAAALATSRLRLGTLVTPVARRRPEQLARQVATLDQLSDGRATLGVGLGGPIGDEYGRFGDTTDPVEIAGRLDEGLSLLSAFWSGAPVSHSGRHFTVDDVTLLPATVQQPRVPIWVGGFGPSGPPMRRAARWDGVVPLFGEHRHGDVPPVEVVREVLAYVGEQRGSLDGFDVVLGGVTTPASAGDVVGPLAEA